MRLGTIVTLSAFLALAACDQTPRPKVGNQAKQAPDAASTTVATAPGVCPPADRAPVCPPAATPAKAAPVAAAPVKAHYKAKPRRHVKHHRHAHKAVAPAREYARVERNAYAEEQQAERYAYVEQHPAPPPPQLRYEEQHRFEERRVYDSGMEQRRLIEEQRRQAYEAGRRAEREAMARAEEQRRYAESVRIEEQRRYAEQRRVEEMRRYEEHRRIEEQRRYQAERAYAERRAYEARQSYSEQHYQSGSSSGAYVASGGYVASGCCVRPAAGRDANGFLTWPGKR